MFDDVYRSPHVGDGLGAMWGREKAESLLKEAGFSSVEIHRLDHNFQNDYYVMQK